MIPVQHKLTALLLAPLLLAAMHTSQSAPAMNGADTPAVEKALADPAAARLAKPTPGQIEWADLERGMFVHFGPATWRGVEHDLDDKADISVMNPSRF